MNTNHFRGSDVIDPDQNVIGTIDDVMYDAEELRRGPSSISGSCVRRTTCPSRPGT